jgi:DNA-binding NtrC family response regulator
VCVVLTDYNLPDGRWTRVLEHARKRAPGTEVVVYSNLVDEHLWAEVLCLGGFDVIGQPFDEEELLRVTGCAWRESQVKRDLIANCQ